MWKYVFSFGSKEINENNADFLGNDIFADEKFKIIFSNSKTKIIFDQWHSIIIEEYLIPTNQTAIFRE